MGKNDSQLNISEIESFTNLLEESLKDFFEKIDPIVVKKLRFKFEQLTLEHNNYMKALENVRDILDELDIPWCYSNDYASREMLFYDERQNQIIESINEKITIIMNELKNKYPIINELDLLNNLFKSKEFSLKYYISLRNSKLTVEDYFKYVSNLMYTMAVQITENMKKDIEFYEDVVEVISLKEQLQNEEEQLKRLMNLKKQLTELFDSESVKKLIKIIKQSGVVLCDQKKLTIDSYKKLMGSEAELRTFNENLILGYYSRKKDSSVEDLKKYYCLLWSKHQEASTEYSQKKEEEKPLEEDIINHFLNLIEIIINLFPDFKRNDIFKNSNKKEFSVKDFIQKEFDSIFSIDCDGITNKIIEAVFKQIDSQINILSENIKKDQSCIFQKAYVLGIKYKNNSNINQVHEYLFSDEVIPAKEFTKKLQLRPQ